MKTTSQSIRGHWEREWTNQPRSEPVPNDDGEFTYLQCCVCRSREYVCINCSMQFAKASIQSEIQQVCEELETLQGHYYSQADDSLGERKERHRARAYGIFRAIKILKSHFNLTDK